MFLTRYRHGVLLSLALTCGFLSIFTVKASAQESVVATTSDESFVATNTIINPYKNEALVGDKVFDDFVLGPGKVELQLKPGETKTVNISVANRMAEAKRFLIDVEDIAGSDNPEQSVVLLGEDRGPYTLKDYISVPQTEFELGPNLRAIIPVTIHIPVDAEAGGFYGSVLVRTVTREATGGSDTAAAPRSAIISRIGSLFFVTVPGDLNEEGQLKDFSTTNNKLWYEKGPVDFQILYQNTGSIHLNPYGELRIKNMLGEEVGFVELQPWFSLPQSLRSREVSWNRDLMFGRYTATLKLNRGYGDIIDESQISFWVIPWKLVSLAFAALVLLLWLLRNFFKKFEFKRKVE